MIKRIMAIGLIFSCTTIAWMILGATIFSRTYDADSRLESKVASSWGTRQTQTPPNAMYWATKVKRGESAQSEQTVIHQVGTIDPGKFCRSKAAASMSP